MITIDRLLGSLERVTSTGAQSWSALCPAHDDKNPSLSVGLGDDGRILLKCFAGCSVEQICAALGIEVRDLFADSDRQAPPPKRPRPRPRADRRRFASAEAATEAALQIVCSRTKRHDWKLAHAFVYQNANGTECMRVLRFEPLVGNEKQFVPIHPEGATWFIGDPEGPLPLYRLPDLSRDGRVYVCEGEKAAERARALGLIATTSAHGASSALRTDWSPLAGREVAFLLDNDGPGRKYADDGARLLTEVDPPARVRIAALPGLPPGGDIVEFSDRLASEGLTPAQVAARVDAYVGSEPFVELVDDELRPAYVPFPLSALPPSLVRFVSVSAEALGCDPAYVALPLFAVCASAIGHSRSIVIKQGWTEPAVIWVLIVGDSGTLKSPALDIALKPLQALQQEAFESHAEEMKRYEQELAEHERKSRQYRHGQNEGEPPVRPPKPRAARLIVSDTTTEALAQILEANAHGVLLYRDELSGWFASFDRYANNKGGDAAFWLQVHGARAIVIDRKSGDPKTIYVPRASVSIVGGIQPAVLARSLSGQNLENGLAARFLMVMPPRRRKRWNDAELDKVSLDLLIDTVQFLYRLSPEKGVDGRPKPKELTFTDKGRKAWIEFYDEHADLQALATGHEAAALAKLEGAAARIALVIHEVRVVSGDPSVVSDDHVDEVSVGMAVELIRWLRVENRRIYSMLKHQAGEVELSSLLGRVKQLGGTVTIRTWQRFRSLRTAHEAEAELQGLVDAGLGHWVTPPRKGKGRTPKPSFSLGSNQEPPSSPRSDASDTSDTTDRSDRTDRSRSPKPKQHPPDHGAADQHQAGGSDG